MFTKDQGKIKIMFQGAIQKKQNIIRKKNIDKSQSQYGILSKKMATSLHDQSTAVLRLVNNNFLLFATCTQKATRKHSTTNLC